MLLPALSKARERARIAVCMNNLKQIGLSIAMYLEDYDGWYPAGGASEPQCTSQGVPLRRAPALLWQLGYMKVGLLACPSDRIVQFQSYPDLAGAKNVSYLFNQKLFYNFDPDPQRRYSTPFKREWHTVPHKDIVAVDMEWYWGATPRPQPYYTVSWRPRRALNTNNDYGVAIHHGSTFGGNILFADGHVELVNWRKYLSELDNKGSTIRITGIPSTHNNVNW
ncbi:MAG: DUF1559 domain-containing protein [bacterium]|nr:DUF1559 domain-containing protein [bacterium]